jgi:hypothetical protein
MKQFFRIIQNENIVSALLVAFSFSIYLLTMCRSVGFTDSGELATVIYTLGIAHPTGYPFFTLLGRCWGMIPMPIERIIQLNILSALLTAFAVGLFSKTAFVLQRVVNVFPNSNGRRKELDQVLFRISVIVGSLSLAFSSTFWSQSTNIEVYALHLVLVLMSILSFILALEEQQREPLWISPWLFIFAFVVGISFANHMTTILLAPACLWLFFKSIHDHKYAFRLIIKLIPFYVLGLSPYLYLIVRSSSYPLLDWGHPATLERFFWHVSGKQFRVWMFSGWGVIQKQFGYFLENFLSEYNIIALFGIFIGAFWLFKYSRRFFIFLILLILTTILYAINYDIFDIGSYFLLCYITIGWLLVFGSYVVIESFERYHRLIKVVIGLMILFIPILQVGINWKKVDESNNKLPQEYVEEAFSKLEPGAVVFASQWDCFISPGWYYQNICQLRKDITIVDKSLLQNRSWYFMQLERQAPWLMNRVKFQTDLFLAELDKFEHELPFNFMTIQARWQNLLAEMIAKSINDHPVYVDARIEQEFPVKYSRVPSGFFLKLTNDTDTTSYSPTSISFIPTGSVIPVKKDQEQYAILMLLRCADWLIQHARYTAANVALDTVLCREPGNTIAFQLKRKLPK